MDIIFLNIVGRQFTHDSTDHYWSRSTKTNSEIKSEMWK